MSERVESTVFADVEAEIAAGVVSDACMKRVNDALLDHGLRLTRLGTRRDPITAEDIDLVLSAWPKYQEAVCLADDVQLLYASDEIPFDLQADTRGVLHFRRGISPRPTEAEMRSLVRAARRHRNDPDGITFQQPPYVVLVGNVIGEYGDRPPPADAPRFIFVLQRSGLGTWEPPDESRSRLFIRWVKDMLFWERVHG